MLLHQEGVLYNFNFIEKLINLSEIQKNRKKNIINKKNISFIYKNIYFAINIGNKSPRIILRNVISTYFGFGLFVVPEIYNPFLTNKAMAPRFTN